MQKQNMNWFATVLRVVICFIILTDLIELSVEFCVDKVIKDRGGLDMRRRRCNAPDVTYHICTPTLAIFGSKL